MDITPSHLIVTGITQLSGKTTTLEALISRSGLKTKIRMLKEDAKVNVNQGAGSYWIGRFEAIKEIESWLDELEGEKT